MIIGRVDQRLNPIIPVDILEQGRRLHRREMLIDTWFEGYLMLPERLIVRMGGTPNRKITMTLANERSSDFAEYLLEIYWHDQVREVGVLASENELLVGRYLLAGCHVGIEMTPGGAVTVTELPAS